MGINNAKFKLNRDTLNSKAKNCSIISFNGYINL